jgi:predicted nucleotidyltransferase
MEMPSPYQRLVDRFVAVCRADPRVVAASLGGSYARGAADAYSDLDLDVVTSDEAYAEFAAERAAFVRQLGEPLLVEDFDLPGMVFFIFRDGCEGEIAFAPAGDLSCLHAGPHRVLVDKLQRLTGAPVPWPAVATDDQRETLRRLLQWFWHDLAHFVAALGRGQLWWAHGQLEDLRRYCVNLLWLERDFTRRPEAYEKVELVVPEERLAPLAATYCPHAYAPLLAAGETVVRCFRELAQPLARAHGLRYPVELDGLLGARLQALSTRGAPTGADPHR